MLHTCCLHKGLVRKENCIGTESCNVLLAKNYSPVTLRINAE
jgi:hypothetical protein